MYVPYNPNLLDSFWNAIMTTIASTANLGFNLFIPIIGIALLIAIVNKYV